MRIGRICTFPSKRPAPASSGIVRLVLGEKAELSRLACRRFQTEMRKGGAGHHAAARRALNETLLQQIRLDDFLNGIARFAERRGDCLDADRSATKGFRDQ